MEEIKIEEGTMYIMRGIPGSGKSTIAAGLGLVISADDHFMVEGEYRFDPTRIAEAHASCFRRAVLLAQGAKKAPFVIDNTNCTNIEVAPYVLLAQAYGWKHQIVAIQTESAYVADICARRNTHGVPIERVTAMHALLSKELAATPPWWNQILRVPRIDP